MPKRRLLQLFGIILITGISFHLIGTCPSQAAEQNNKPKFSLLDRAVPAKPGEKIGFDKYAGQERLKHFDRAKYDELAQQEQYVPIIWDLRSHDRLPRAVFRWLKHKADAGHVMLQYELAREYWKKKDPKKALLYFHIARIATTMDAGLYADNSVGSARGGLEMAYPQLAALTREKEDLNKKEFKAAIRWHEKNQHRQLPLWLASHGMSAFDGKVALIPQDQWEPKRQAILASFKASLKEENQPAKPIPNPVGHFVLGPKMNEARYQHTATLLDDGNVLIVGGNPIDGYGYAKSAELYLAKENKFIPIPGLKVPRRQQAAVKIDNGKVLFFGGEGLISRNPYKDDATDIIEEYDPATREFRIIGKMLDPRWPCTAVKLDDGRVFIYGGAGFDTQGQWHCELYDPKTNTSAYTSKMHYRGVGNAMAKLSDGRVFINRGVFTPEEAMNNKLNIDIHVLQKRKAAVEIYSPRMDIFNLQIILPPHYGSFSQSLANNQVLLLANQVFGPSSRQRKYLTQIYDANSGKMFAVGKSQISWLSREMPLIKNRYVLITGINQEKTKTLAEAVDIKKNNLIEVGEMHILRGSYTATLLENGNILIAGGRHHKSYKKTGISEIFKVF